MILIYLRQLKSILGDVSNYFNGKVGRCDFEMAYFQEEPQDALVQLIAEWNLSWFITILIKS